MVEGASGDAHLVVGDLVGAGVTGVHAPLLVRTGVLVGGALSHAGVAQLKVVKGASAVANLVVGCLEVA